MIPTMLVVLVVANLIGIVRKKNNTVVIAISIILIYGIMAFNTFTSDYPYYENYYNTQLFSGSFEHGFVLLSKILYAIGLNYQAFLQVFFLLGIFIASFAVKEMETNLHCVILLYSLTQIYMDTNEIRQFMAYCFYAVALTEYAKNNSKVRYVLLCVGAIAFQRSTLLLLPFPFLFSKIKYREKVLKAYFIVIVMFCTVVFANGNRIPGLNQILILCGLPDKAVYFETSTHFGFLLFWAAYFSNMLIVYFAKREIRKHEIKYYDVQKKYVDNLWDFLIYTAFAMPLCMLNGEFLRYYKFSVFPVIIVISMMINKKTYIIKRKHIIRLLPFDLSIYYYIAAYSITFQHWRVVGEVVSNNLLDSILG